MTARRRRLARPCRRLPPPALRRAAPFPMRTNNMRLVRARRDDSRYSPPSHHSSRPAVFAAKPSLISSSAIRRQAITHLVQRYSQPSHHSSRPAVFAAKPSLISSSGIRRQGLTCRPAGWRDQPHWHAATRAAGPARQACGWRPTVASRIHGEILLRIAAGPTAGAADTSSPCCSIRRGSGPVSAPGPAGQPSRPGPQPRSNGAPSPLSCRVHIFFCPGPFLRRRQSPAA